MQIKIYVDELPIYITNELTEELKELSNLKDVFFLNKKILVNAADVISTLQNKEKKAAIIYNNNFQKLKADFFEQLQIVEAAGGIVQNENKDLLFIYRRSKWDLPKGKIEAGETPEICAEREIEEETGVKNLLLKHKIGETYHIYTEKSQTILKVSNWFNFTTTNKQEIIPQKEEDIEEVKWIHTKDIKEPMKNTYQNIKDILTVFFDTP